MELTALKKAKHIWVYGAGKVGEKVLGLLSHRLLDVTLDGIVVSCIENTPNRVKGYIVKGIAELDTADDETFFVVAVSEKYHREIEVTLQKEGYHHYLFWTERMAREIWELAEYTFVDRRKGREKACFVLSGYKPFLWKDVFRRLEKFVPEDVDVCILSSGLWDDTLAEIAQKNEWSILSTKRNDITLIQNVAMVLFDKAKWFYKMDEDIFVTHGCFEQMWKMYDFVERQEPYKIGYVAPLIPVNGYGYLRILERQGQLADYEKHFGRALYGGNLKNAIELDAKAAIYMWGGGKNIPQLDVLNEQLKESGQIYSICGVRFSIGFILFHRTLWELIGGFKVTGKDIDLGIDEIQLCDFCMKHSHAIIIAENTVVGHFSFGPQTEKMKMFYQDNSELFSLSED